MGSTASPIFQIALKDQVPTTWSPNGIAAQRPEPILDTDRGIAFGDTSCPANRITGSKLPALRCGRACASVVSDPDLLLLAVNRGVRRFRGAIRWRCLDRPR